jgi:hypothetical protein
MQTPSFIEMRRYAARARVLVRRPTLDEADRMELEYYAVWFESRAERGVGLPKQRSPNHLRF